MSSGSVALADRHRAGLAKPPTRAVESRDAKRSSKPTVLWTLAVAVLALCVFANCHDSLFDRIAGDTVTFTVLCDNTTYKWDASSGWVRTASRCGHSQAVGRQLGHARYCDGEKTSMTDHRNPHVLPHKQCGGTFLDAGGLIGTVVVVAHRSFSVTPRGPWYAAPQGLPQTPRVPHGSECRVS
jgi:hypothetical protein